MVLSLSCLLIYQHASEFHIKATLGKYQPRKWRPFIPLGYHTHDTFRGIKLPMFGLLTAYNSFSIFIHKTICTCRLLRIISRVISKFTFLANFEIHNLDLVLHALGMLKSVPGLTYYYNHIMIDVMTPLHEALNSSLPGQNGRYLGRRQFQMHFLQWKLQNSISYFTEICSQGCNWQ